MISSSALLFTVYPYQVTQQFGVQINVAVKLGSRSIAFWIPNTIA